MKENLIKLCKDNGFKYTANNCCINFKAKDVRVLVIFRRKEAYLQGEKGLISTLLHFGFEDVVDWLRGYELIA